MPFIENISLDDVVTGKHKGRDVLIRILDPNLMDFPETKHQFQEVHEFRFTDFDYMDVKILYNRNPEKDPRVISENDAKEIIKILNKALLENKNVTVHCLAGIFRSGTIAEIGKIMGFELIPNDGQIISLIFDKLMLASEENI